MEPLGEIIEFTESNVKPNRADSGILVEFIEVSEYEVWMHKDNSWKDQ